jgi:hypothetical protein
VSQRILCAEDRRGEQADVDSAHLSQFPELTLLGRRLAGGGLSGEVRKAAAIGLIA